MARPLRSPPTAVVTGAGGRIGRCLVDELTGAGYRVTGLDLPAACPGRDPRFRPCDVTDEREVGAVFAQYPRIDLLVLCAAVSAIGRFGDHDVAVHRAVLEVTHPGAVSCSLAALPALRRAGGRIVLLGSVAGFAPVLGRPPYVAAKHAVTGLFTAIRPELERNGVGLTIVHPAFVTGGMSEAGPRRGDAGRPVTGPELTPEQVARAALEGASRGRELVLVGRTAWLAWLVSRHAPRVYRTLMLRRLRPQREAER